MNEIKITKSIEWPYHSGAGVYLNMPDKEPIKLSFNINDYARIHGVFDKEAAEFAYFCAVIYGCDRAIHRESGDGDRWTREFSVEIPVSDPARWERCRGTGEKMLEFLTGDLWRLTFVSDSIPLFGPSFRKTRSKFRLRSRAKGSAVSLFSGGLDSITGIIDWLEKNPEGSLILASTYDAHAENARSDQDRLLPELCSAYPGRTTRFVARSGLATRGDDINFRSRSLTFLGNGVLAASFIGENARILIPENGAIALNFPLSPARSGSLSTRTVHPHFINQFNQFLDCLEFSYRVTNPYQFKTKGEILNGCQNKPFLQNIYQKSVSCGKRGFGKIHWHDRSAMACGHCIPCIFRQAAVNLVAFAPENYGCTVSNKAEWGGSDLLKPNGDLQSVIDFVNADLAEESIWRRLRSNGHLEREHRSAYVNLVVRLRYQLKDWLTSVGLS